MAVAAVIQRPLRGSRVSTFYPVKTLPLLSSLDSAFQLQEYISLLIRHNVHDVERIVALPGKPGGKDKGKDGDETTEVKSEEKDPDKVKGDVTVDEACWIYEQLRRLAQDLTHPLITMLQQECSRTTCPEMKAGEWLYLCVAHGTDGAMEQCCAIDYILHTLDSATALLNSPRAFPSRLQIPPASHRHFTSLARRLGRIFAHAYFHHRDIFAQAEAESSLYARFLALTTHFDLVPPDFIVVPPTKVTTDGEADENDIPRHSTVDKEGEHKPSVFVPDPAEVQPPRLLAASLEPKTEREKEKGHLIQHYPSAPTSSSSSSATAPINPTIRILSNRGPAGTPVTTKNRNPPGLFVSNNGLIPFSAAATAAPTTAASLFASSEAQLSTTSVPASSSIGATGSSAGTSSGLGVEPGMSTLATGQESPRRASRPRTDTMVYSEGYTGNGSGRGTSPIPIVRLGARLNEPEEKKDREKAIIAVAETPIPTLVTKEPEPFVVEERREESELEKEELDFVPIDDEMEVIDVTDVQEGKAELDGDPPPVSEEEQAQVQTEPAVTLSEPEVEAVISEEQAQQEEDAQRPLSDQGQPEQLAVEALSEPSQVELVHENGAATAVGEEAAEAGNSAERPGEAADEPEQGQTGEDMLVDGSSTEAVEDVGLQNADSSDADVTVEDKEANQTVIVL